MGDMPSERPGGVGEPREPMTRLRVVPPDRLPGRLRPRRGDPIVHAERVDALTKCEPRGERDTGSPPRKSSCRGEDGG